MKIKKERGITLIALVVTIVILLILAGVSINLVLGQNGLIAKAQEAALKTDKASLNEKIQMAIVAAQMEDNEYKELTAENLGSALIQDGTKAIVSENEDGTIHILFLDEKKEYRLNSDGNIEDLNIDFYAKYVAPESQDEERNNGVIGIGTDGKPVDMDLWEYTLLDDGTYGLNDEESLLETDIGTASYSNENLVNGKIQGAMPQYIKKSSENAFIPVTHIDYCFYKTELTEAPIIPDTVVCMRAAFNSCEKLTKMPDIPGNVLEMYGTFAACSSLIEVTDIPNSVINMGGTFRKCTSLTVAPKLSTNVTDLYITFSYCSALKEIPMIPDSVTNMSYTFQNCTSLTKIPNIPNNVTNMYCTFENCTSLIEAPVIPNSVTILTGAFMHCNSLQGIIEINANVTGKELGEEFHNNIDYLNCLYDSTTKPGLTLKVTGSCPVLQQIVDNANNPNITLE